MPARPVAPPGTPLAFMLLLVYIATVPLASFFNIRLEDSALRLLPCDFIFVLVVLASLPVLFRRVLRPGIFEALLALYLAATLVSTLVSGAGYAGLLKVAYLVSVAALTRWILQGRPEGAVSAWMVGTAMAVVGGLLGIATFYLGWSNWMENPLLGH